MLRGTPSESIVDELVLMGFAREDVIEATGHSVPCRTPLRAGRSFFVLFCFSPNRAAHTGEDGAVDRRLREREAVGRGPGRSRAPSSTPSTGCWPRRPFVPAVRGRGVAVPLDRNSAEEKLCGCFFSVAVAAGGAATVYHLGGGAHVSQINRDVNLAKKAAAAVRRPCAGLGGGFPSFGPRV